MIEKEWTTEDGYAAQVVAQPMGHRCGYITVPSTHPAYGKDYADLDIEVHGSLTFGQGGTFGFDCAHFMDKKDESIMSDEYLRIEKMYSSFVSEDATIKGLAFCECECEFMSKQFKRMEQQ